MAFVSCARTFSQYQLGMPSLLLKCSIRCSSSVSAINFKLRHRHRTPQYQTKTSEIRDLSAAEAVSNILYNMPPPDLTKPSRHVLNLLVQDEPGVLSRISGTLAGRGFNIDSLAVCKTEVPDLSRMTVVMQGQDAVVKQACRQLEDLVPVWAVLEYTKVPIVERELLLCKVNLLGHRYFQRVLSEHKQYFISNEPELDITAYNNEQSETKQIENSDTSADTPVPGTKSAAASDKAERLKKEDSGKSAEELVDEMLYSKHYHLNAVTSIVDHFGAKIVDISDDSALIEFCAKTSRIINFLALLKPFGVSEVSRTGAIVLPRSPLRDANKYNCQENIERPDTENVSLNLPPG